MKLFEFQEDSIERIRSLLSQGFKRIGLQLRTGAGKTFIGKNIIVSVLGNGKRIGFILHGNKLMEQTMKVFSNMEYGLIWASRTKHTGRPFLLISQKSLLSKFDSYKEVIQSLDVLMVDEAHDCTSDGYRKILEFLPEKTIVIGLSATFLKKSDGQGHEFWEKVIEPISAQELLNLGRLPEIEIISPDIDYNLDNVKMTTSKEPDYQTESLYEEMSKSTTLFGDMWENYQKYNPEKLPAIAFCVNIKHCTEVADYFELRGVKTLIIHSKLPKESKKSFEKNLRYYLNNQIPFIICSVDMLSRGVDIPELRVGLHLRPTKSRLKWIQQVGRLTRGEGRKILIDFTTNYHMHGSPYLKFDPELESESERRKKKKLLKSPKRCKSCDAVNEPYYSHCIVCGTCLLADHDVKYITEIGLRRATLEERDEKLRKFIKQKSYVVGNDDYGNKTDDWLHQKALKKFGKELFLSSEHIPIEKKREVVKNILEKK